MLSSLVAAPAAASQFYELVRSWLPEHSSLPGRAGEASMDALPENELPAFRDSSPEKHGRLRPARAYVDFRPGIDRVVRRGERCFIVDGWGQYAVVEVETDKLTPEKAAWYDSLEGRHRTGMVIATWGTCLLSREGKMERLAAMGVGLAFQVIYETRDEPPEQRETPP